MKPYEALICGIFEQAVEDYRELKKSKILKQKDSSGWYSTRDIEMFFHSEWSTKLLEMIGSETTGDALFQRIRLHLRTEGLIA